jgi:hypothetical protein
MFREYAKKDYVNAMKGLREIYVKFLNVPIIVAIKDSAIEENAIVSMDFTAKIARKY